MDIEVFKGDITGLDIEAIVNPANSRLIMGGGLAGVIKNKGGKEIEDEARKKAPVEVGKATVTSAGDLPAKYVIHAPTMENPAEDISPENVRLATCAVLNCAEENKIREVAVPGLGTGVGGVSSEEAAKVMVEEIQNFDPESLEKVVLVGYDEELYEAFEKWKDRLAEE